jgi:hypothetical protein
VAWSLVREVTTATGGTSAVSRTYTLGAAATSVATGNLLVVFAGGLRVLATPFISSVGNIGTWTVAVNSDGGSGGQSVAVCYALVTGALNSTDSITLTQATAGTPAVYVEEFSAGAAISSASTDKALTAGSFGQTSFNSGTTAALAGASDLVAGFIIFYDGSSTDTVTPEVLSPVWNTGTTTYLTTPADASRYTYRWRDPAATTAVRFQGTHTGAAADYCATVVAITAATGAAAAAPAPPAFNAIPFIGGGL